MRVLVATKETQGCRTNDFCWVPAGELVIRGVPCDTDLHDPDGSCGCNRAMTGVKCRKATTTAKIVEKPFTHAKLLRLIAKSYADSGFKVSSEYIDQVTADMLDAASRWPLGTVLEYRDGVYGARPKNAKSAAAEVWQRLEKLDSLATSKRAEQILAKDWLAVLLHLDNACTCLQASVEAVEPV